MRATWDDLPAKAQNAIKARRHDNAHAAGLWYALVTLPAEEAYRSWVEDLADAHGDGDEAKIATLYEQRYKHAEASAWDVRDEYSVDDGGEEDDDVTVH